MKKYILLIILLICTGCNKVEYLNCTKEQTDNGLTMKESLKLEINKDKPISINVDVAFDLEGSYLEHKDVVKTNIDEIVNNYQNKKGIQVSTLENEGNITINLQAIYSEFDESIENDILGIKKYNIESINVETIKGRLEKEGYSCDISNE